MTRPGLFLTLSNVPAPRAGAGCLPGLSPEVSGEEAARASRLLALRNSGFGPHTRDGEGDSEDFWEMAARLAAAMDSPADEVWVAWDGEPRLLRGAPASKLAPEARLALPAPDEARLMAYGPLPRHSHFWLRPGATVADTYAQWPAFGRHAGRYFTLGGMYVDAHRDLAILIKEWVRCGVAAEGEAVLVKARKAKQGMWAIPASASSEANREALQAAMGWTAVQFEGVEKAFLLQKCIPLAYEYRMFMVGGVPVTGAGCVEEFTPLSNSCAFDDRMRYRRPGPFFSPDGAAAVENQFPLIPAPLERRPDLLQAYLSLATTVGRELQRDLAFPATCTLDFAWNIARSSPLLLEANSLGASGLYATDPSLVVQALLAGP